MTPEVPFQPNPILQPAKKSKKGLIISILVGLVVLVAAYFVFSYVSMNSNKKAGQKYIEQHISDLKSGDSEKVRLAIFEMLGVSDDTSDPAKLTKVAGVALMTSVISEGLKNVEPTLVKSSFGKTPKGNLLVTNEYSITHLGVTANYIAQAHKVSGTWKLYSVETTTP